MVTVAPNCDQVGVVRLFDHPGVGKQHLQLLDAPFNESLLVLGGFVFGVLDQLSAFHRLMQTLGNFLAPDRAQVFQLFL